MNEAAQGPLWRAGEVIDGRYEVIRLAGQGGMGRIYQVKHLEWGIAAWCRTRSLHLPAVRRSRRRELDSDGGIWAEQV